ncbi:MAG: inositol monophosphatase family protein [Actinomycetota bacterium]
MNSSTPPTTAPDGVDLSAARDVLGEALDEVAGWLLADSGDVEVTAKADGTPVTDADTSVDDHLRARLTAAFPDHGVLSEERGTRSPTTAWTWVIDPIDGTSNYTNRLPYWCISVALLHDGEPVLAMIDAPVLARRYIALAGGGAEVVTRTTSLDGREDRLRSRPLQVRPPVAWRDPSNRHVPLMLTTGTARRARGAGVRLNPRVMGSTALDLAMVAEGVAAASLAKVPKVWDVAAGVLLVREAGGVIVTVDGEPLLPLAGDVEQVARSAVTASGPDEPYVRELAAALLGGSNDGRAVEDAEAGEVPAGASGASGASGAGGLAGASGAGGLAGTDATQAPGPDRTSGPT